MALNSRYEIGVKGILDPQWTSPAVRPSAQNHQEETMHPVITEQFVANHIRGDTRESRG